MEGSIANVVMPWNDITLIPFKIGTSLEFHERCDLIRKQLECARISNVHDLVNVIKSFHCDITDKGVTKPHWQFRSLVKFFTDLNELEKEKFFGLNGVLSTIRRLALQLKELLPEIKILKSGSASSITLNQIQIAGILSNAFFCTFPKSKADCPSINFFYLYENKNEVSQMYQEKLKCLLHYFNRVHLENPSGNVSFYRLFIPDHQYPRFNKSSANLCDLEVKTEGTIEDQDGYIQMDFANCYVGGGVLSRGCVQEEIRFLICPELIAARLFTEKLNDTEALLVIGVERYSKYKGYSDSFTFDGTFKDTTPFDEKKRKKTYVIMVDASNFRYPLFQYRESKILRELKKAYVGFKANEDCENLCLATGHWGCGAFGGDPQLKALIQIMAASVARRNVLYLTFGNIEFTKKLDELYLILRENNVKVGVLYGILRSYFHMRSKRPKIFDFVIRKYVETDEFESAILDTMFSLEEKIKEEEKKAVSTANKNKSRSPSPTLDEVLTSYPLDSLIEVLKK